MKLLMFYTKEWWYKTASKTLPDVPDADQEEKVDHAVVIFFHCEGEDEGKYESVVQKFVKNAKWIAGKFGTKNTVLHSFNHLSSSKSSPEFARRLLGEVTERLQRTGYSVMTTPFGYFNEFISAREKSGQLCQLAIGYFTGETYRSIVRMWIQKARMMITEEATFAAMCKQGNA